MSENVKSSQQGLTLQEALYKFCDPEKVKDYKQSMDNPGGLTGNNIVVRKAGFSWVRNEHRPAQNRPETNVDLAKKIHENLWQELRKKLFDGELIARARKRSVTADFIDIPASAWNKLRVKDWTESKLVECSRPDRTYFYDVEIFDPQDNLPVVQPMPESATSTSRPNAAGFVQLKVTEFAENNGFNGAQLAAYFDQHGEKASFIKDMQKTDRPYEQSTLRKQLNDLLKDESFLPSIGN